MKQKPETDKAANQFLTLGEAARRVGESLKRYHDEIMERERTQERIDNLNVSPLQQRINKIRKIAEEAKERIDRKGNILNSTRFQYKPIVHKGTPTFEVEEIRPKYDYQEKIYPVHPSTNGLHQGGLTTLDDDELNI